LDYSPYIKAWKKRLEEERKRMEERRRSAQSWAQRIASMLREDFGAKEVWLFGSVLWEGRFGRTSDIDLAVRGIPPSRYIEALVESERMTGYKFQVDIVPLEDCHPVIRRRVEKEGVRLV